MVFDEHGFEKAMAGDHGHIVVQLRDPDSIIGVENLIDGDFDGKITVVFVGECCPASDDVQTRKPVTRRLLPGSSNGNSRLKHC